jgi:hypothetical protein
VNHKSVILVYVLMLNINIFILRVFMNRLLGYRFFQIAKGLSEEGILTELL